MATKLVYLFDKDTFLYLQDFYAQESPLQPGVFILPQHYTETSPQPAREGYTQIYTPATDTWGYSLIPVPTPEVIDPEEALRLEVESNINNILFLSLKSVLFWVAEQPTAPRDLRVARSQIIEQEDRLP